MDLFQNFVSKNNFSTDALSPKERKPYPFPLERLEEDIATAYELIDRIYKKIQTSETNPINNSSDARKKRIKSLKYKTKTCLSLLKQISVESSELWF
jgi:hypothetical protein